MGQQVSHCMGFISSLALYSSPFWMLVQMVEAVRSSQHGCKLSGGVWRLMTLKWMIDGIKSVIPNLSISFNSWPVERLLHHHVILLGMAPQNMGYINRSACHLTPQDNYLHTMNHHLHTILICQLSWTMSTPAAVNVLPADLHKVITQFFPIFSLHMDALTDIMCSCSINNAKFNKHRSVQFLSYSLVTNPY